MSRYFIEEAKCGITDGGVACGPMPGSVVVTVKFKENGASKWLSLVEVDGIVNVFLLDKDYHDVLVENQFDETIADFLNEHLIHDFNGLDISDDYFDTIASIYDDPENPAIPFVRYIIALARCSMDEVDELIEMATGKYADEIDPPVSDVEEEYLEEQEKDE